MKINNLCTIKNNTLTGPMSPMLLAKDICANLGIRLSGVARVWWDNDRTLQYKDEDSGLDTVVYKEEHKDDTALYLFLDTGIGAMPIALRTKNDKEITYSPVYKDDEKFIKPTDEEIAEVFETIFNNMSLIIPKAA